MMLECNLELFSECFCLQMPTIIILLSVQLAGLVHCSGIYNNYYISFMSFVYSEAANVWPIKVY